MPIHINDCTKDRRHGSFHTRRHLRINPDHCIRHLVGRKKTKRLNMIGMHLSHASGVAGYVDAESVAPDGAALVRINDMWFLADEVGPL